MLSSKDGGFWDAPQLQYKDIKPLTKAPTEVGGVCVYGNTQLTMKLTG